MQAATFSDHFLIGTPGGPPAAEQARWALPVTCHAALYGSRHLTAALVLAHRARLRHHRHAAATVTAMPRVRRPRVRRPPPRPPAPPPPRRRSHPASRRSLSAAPGTARAPAPPHSDGTDSSQHAAQVRPGSAVPGSLHDAGSEVVEIINTDTDPHGGTSPGLVVGTRRVSVRWDTTSSAAPRTSRPGPVAEAATPSRTQEMHEYLITWASEAPHVPGVHPATAAADAAQQNAPSAQAQASSCVIATNADGRAAECAGAGPRCALIRAGAQAGGAEAPTGAPASPHASGACGNGYGTGSAVDTIRRRCGAVCPPEPGHFSRRTGGVSLGAMPAGRERCLSSPRGALDVRAGGSGLGCSVWGRLAACHRRTAAVSATALGALPPGTPAEVFLEQLLSRFRLCFMQPGLDVALHRGGSPLHLAGLRVLKHGGRHAGGARRLLGVADTPASLKAGAVGFRAQGVSAARAHAVQLRGLAADVRGKLGLEDAGPVDTVALRERVTSVAAEEPSHRDSSWIEAEGDAGGTAAYEPQSSGKGAGADEDRPEGSAGSCSWTAAKWVGGELARRLSAPSCGESVKAGKGGAAPPRQGTAGSFLLLWTQVRSANYNQPGLHIAINAFHRLT